MNNERDSTSHSEKGADGLWAVIVHNENDEGWDVPFHNKKFKTLKAAKEFYHKLQEKEG